MVVVIFRSDGEGGKQQCRLVIVSWLFILETVYHQISDMSLGMQTLLSSWRHSTTIRIFSWRRSSGSVSPSCTPVPSPQPTTTLPLWSKLVEHTRARPCVCVLDRRMCMAKTGRWHHQGRAPRFYQPPASSSRDEQIDVVKQSTFIGSVVAWCSGSSLHSFCQSMSATLRSMTMLFPHCATCHWASVNQGEREEWNYCASKCLYVLLYVCALV